MKKLLVFSILIFGVAWSSLIAQYKVEDEPQEFELLNNYEIASGKNSDSKYMFKLTTTGGSLNNASFGLEYKFLKSFSIGAYLDGSSFFTILPQTEPVPIGTPTVFESIRNFSLYGSIEARYYANQEGMIAQGFGDNLNGFYVISGIRSQLYNSFLNEVEHAPFFGVGVQSRILKYGLIDFSLLAQIQNNRFSIYPGIRAGFAFSKDYKLLDLENARCNILKCFDEKKYQFKLPLNGLMWLNYRPDLNYIGLVLIPKIAFEHRLLKGVSMNHVFSFSTAVNFNFNNELRTSISQSTLSYENNLRYYFLKRKSIATGKSADNLAGLYVASALKYGANYSRFISDDSFSRVNEIFSYGANLGYQGRLFKNFYFDIRAYLNRSKLNYSSELFEIGTFPTRHDTYFNSYGINFDFGVLL